MSGPIVASHALLETKPGVDRETAVGWLESRWGIVGSVTELAGERDKNFRVTATDGAGYILKIYNRTEIAELRDFQHRVMAFAQRQQEVSIPRLVPTTSGADEADVLLNGVPHAAVLMTCLSGVTPSTSSNSGFRYAIGRACGALATALDGFDHLQARRDLWWNHMCLPQLVGLTNLLEDADRRDWVRHHIRHFSDGIAPRAVGLPHQVIHNDLNPSNILVDAQRPHQVSGIIDFGDAVYAPRINEIAVTASYFVDPGAGFVDSLCAIVEGYEAFIPLRDDEIALLPDMICTRLATRILLTHWRYEHFPYDKVYIMRNVPNAWKVIDAFARISPAAMSDQIQERRRTQETQHAG